MKKEDPDLSLTSGDGTKELENLVKFFEEHLTLDVINFLKKKGIGSEVIEKFRIGFGEPLIGFHGNRGKLDGFFNNHLIFPVIKQGQVMDLLGMAFHETRAKYKTLYGKPGVFYNPDALDEEEIVLCHEALDVLALVQAGIPALCVPETVEFSESHIDVLKEKRIFLCFGSDENSRKEMKSIYNQLEGRVKEVYLLLLPDGFKSIYSFFLEQKNPGEQFMELLQHTLENAKKKPISSDANNLEDFEAEYSRRFHKETTGIKTGFAGLDRLLLGGLRGGLYLIHGYVSSGKTMFMRQMADQIAEQQVPVVFVSWDMTTFELWARSMARLLGVSPREILAGRTPLEKVQEVNQAYRKMAEYLFTYEANIETSIDDVENFIHEISSTLGKVPVIFIDHFHRIPILDRDGKPLTNNMALVAYVLHQWSRSLDVPIIISSPREAGVRATDLTPTLEASLDVILSFDPDDNGMDPVKERIRLTLNKNRNGALGYLQLLFDKEKAIFLPCASS